MIDYQRVVDEIRSFLQSPDQTYSASLKELASVFAEACQEVNQRLRRCEEFLQKGLRSEAIHFAQVEPVETSTRARSAHKRKSSDTLPVHMVRSIMSARTQVAIGSASMMHSTAVPRFAA